MFREKAVSMIIGTLMGTKLTLTRRLNKLCVRVQKFTLDRTCTSDFVHGRIPSGVAVRQPTLCHWSAEGSRSCAGRPNGYTVIRPDGNRSIRVYCKDGWFLMQRRTSASVNFERNWADYATEALATRRRIFGLATTT